MNKLMLTTACAGLTLGAFATTYSYWQGPNGGDYWAPANWSAGVPDKAGMVARFSTSQKPAAGTLVSITNAAAIKADYLEVSVGTWTWRVTGTLSLDGASNDRATISVTGSAKLTIDGGVLENQSCKVATGNGGGTPALEFRNCVTRGLYTIRRGGTDQNSPDTYTVNGGEHRIRTWYPRLYENMVVNSGIVRFGSVHGYDRYGEGKDIRVKTALEVAGGKAVIDGEDKDITSGSVGIVAKARGVAEVTVGGNQIWLASGSADGKHKVDVAWRVEDKALFTAAGPYVAGTGSTGSVEVVGGRFVMTSTFANCGGWGDGRCSSFLLNGGVLDFDYASDGSLTGTKTDVAGSYHKLIAGTSGARLRNRNNVNVTIGETGFTSAENGTGGVTFDGKGKFILGAASAYAGDMTVRGHIQPSVASGAFGTGALTLKDGGTLTTYLTATTELPALGYENAAFVQLYNAASHASTPSVTGSGASVLFLVSDASRTAFGTTDARYVASTAAPTLDALGLPATPIVAITKEDNNSCMEAHLLTYDTETKKFKSAAYETDLTVGCSDKIAYVTTGTSLGGKSYGAVVVKGAAINGTGTIGTGTGNAYLVLLADSRSGTQGQLTGGGTVDFGAARGYVLSGAGVSGQISCGINGNLKGSGGVVFATLDNGGIKVYRTMTYTGGTKILSGRIELTTTGSYKGGFGSGLVEVLGGEYTGGTVRFGYAGTHAQDFSISGFGAATADKTGALYFLYDTTLSGQVTLVNDAMICADTGKTGTFSKAIAGTGDLYLGGVGTIAVPGVDIAGDLHVTGNVTTTGDILTGERFLFVDGTLTFNNTEDIIVDAKVLGAGKIVLAGTGKVDFADLSVFDGTIDLAGKNATIGALYGKAEVVNSGSAATLKIAGKSEFAYFAALPDNVDLAVGGKFLTGPTYPLPVTAALALDGGTLHLYDTNKVASLSGHGAVTGQKLTVTGNTAPAKVDGSRTSLTFDLVPSLNTLAQGWKLKVVGVGAEIREKLGLLMQIR